MDRSVRAPHAAPRSTPAEGAAPRGTALLDARGHACAFFRSDDEEYRVLLPFITEGFTRAERAYHVVDPARRDEHVRRLAGAGIDVAGAVARGQLVLRDWSETYLYGGRFDPDRMVALFTGGDRPGPGDGYPRTRFICHMEWGLESPSLTNELAVYEAVASLTPLTRDVVICAYRVARWDGETLVNAIRTHPAVIIGGLLHENPFYQPAADVLVELRGRTGVSPSPSGSSSLPGGSAAPDRRAADQGTRSSSRPEP